MTEQELQFRLDEAQDVSPSDVSDLLRSNNPNVRVKALTGLTRTAIRRALEFSALLAREQQYSDQTTLTAVQQLSTICDYAEPFIETLKQLGLQAANQGQFETAMRYLQAAVNSGFSAGQKRDSRSRRAMRYAYDADIGTALECLAGGIAPPPMRADLTEPFRLALLCSTMTDEDAPSIVNLKRAQYLKTFGFDVVMVSTEAASSTGSLMSGRLAHLKIPFVQAAGSTYSDKLLFILQYFSQNPAHAILYEASGVDNLGKILACIGLAPVQVWDNKGIEPQSGKFDIIAQALTAEQETKTRWPGIARYYGTPIANGDEIEAATKYSHEELGVPADGIVLATFGRMEKCIPRAYLDAVGIVLQKAPHAWLLLAGPDNFNNMPAIMNAFAQFGVADRVRYLGRRQSDAPRLVKSIDIYCDTHPWPGGQSLLDAMQAGAAIVAMRSAGDKNLDATGSGIGAVTDVVLSGVVDLAASADVQEYARIALRYIEDPLYRSQAGNRARQKALTDCSMQKATEKIGVDIQAKIREKLLAAG